ncbi:entericidin A/B family lipoprotein [Falsirhodobacter halotolerans]|nr:entericidin A/B family lipoprotein [Falsirhodobacter halotolerans]MCJ8139983.1 entericidin A/B family lipoprotein [Falsirhodobacter halotolerans]
MRKLTLLPILALAALAACNTVEGAGQDISTAGSAISQSSREVAAQP